MVQNKTRKFGRHNVFKKKLTKKLTKKYNKTRETISHTKDSIRKANASTIDLKKITEDLFNESSELLKKLISQENGKGGIFHGFNILDNKTLLSFAAYFLAGSYNFLQEKKTSANFLNKKIFNNERIFAKYANGIYSKTKPKGLIKLFKQQHIVDKDSGKGIKLLIPVHGIFKNEITKSIILAIRGTATVQDAIIDGLATTKSLSLDGKKYLAHSGFLKASTFIANERAYYLKELLNKNPGYTLTVTGHSLGGATATITGVLLFDKHFNRKIPINICGFASGTSFTAQKDGKPLEQYLQKYPLLKIKTFIYENDIVPRLSTFEIFVFLATCVSICKLIFLQQKLTLFTNFELTDNDRDDFFKKNPTTRSAIKASGLIGNLKNTGRNVFKSKKFWGGGVINRKIIDIYNKIYSHFKNKFKNTGDFYTLFTSHPGKVLWIKNNNIVEINPYILQAKFKIESLKNHLMNNYTKALSMQNGPLIGGKTKKTKKTLKKKRKKKKSRRN